ncbi:MAG TPA: ABC transporter permease [Gemmatimonadaceae bacterium]|nr:ABC transporter permease [Gemmatimonadaceae bacterium]
MRAGPPLVIATGALATLVALFAVTGAAPLNALSVLWRGSLGSWYALTSGTLLRATPLMLAGLATAVAFRAGVMNIGVEGQLLAGATLAGALALTAPGLGLALLPLGLAAGVAGGALWSALPAVLKRRAGVLEAVTTLMLNAVALYLVGWLVRGPLQEPAHVYPQTAQIVSAARLPILVSGTRLHAGFAIALLLVLAAWWVFTYTSAGFQLRAVGANPRAARLTGGVNPDRVAFAAFLVSGGLAGLAGASEMQGVTYGLYESLSPGYGYTAIAVALLARLDPRAIVPSAVFFAALETGANALQRDAAVPAVVVKVVEALMILTTLAIGALQQRRARDRSGS